MSEMGTLYLVTEAGKEFEVNLCPDSEALYRKLREAVGASCDSALQLRPTETARESQVLHISPRLPLNSPQTRYRVIVIPPNGMLVDEVNMDLLSLENRVLDLEKQLTETGATVPPAVTDIKTAVVKFRDKLETTKHLSWLNCYKELPPSCRRLQYRRRSDARQKVVRDQFLQICEKAISDEIVQCLRLSSFDSMQWSDEELLSLLYFMFSDLGLIAMFSLNVVTLRNFLFQVYKNYNEAPFHNFRHSFCVTQMMYAMVCKADLCRRLGRLEILVLLVSCICHDLDHPGYNNIYQINARTELAIRYNDISPLENHHCSIAFRILQMDESNIFSHFSLEEFKTVREGIIRCILATDMARHNEILNQFKDAVCIGFDFSNKTHVNLLCMVLIKVADISNEARPIDVADPWLDRLLQEFFTQSDAEKVEGLPVTPFMDRDKITKPSSQCSFIGFVLLPLFEALCDLLHELNEMMVEPVRSALEYYRRLNEAQHKNSIAVDSGSTAGTPSPTKNVLKSISSYSMRKTSITFSQPTEDEDDAVIDASTDEEETVTEVAVSEKALKFKISTESSSDRKSYTGSRKGSRERPDDDEDFIRLCESCHRRDAARSNSLIEPEWRFGPQERSLLNKRSVSTTSGRTGGRSPEEEGPTTGATSSKKELAPPPSPSRFVSRLKRLGWRSTGGNDKLSPGSPASLREPKVEKDAEGSPSNERRASTLPKINRRRFASEARKGWRGLLTGRKGCDDSDQNGVSPEESTTGSTPSPMNNNRRSHKVSTSVDSASSSSSPQRRWMSSLVSSFRSKKYKNKTESPS